MSSISVATWNTQWASMSSDRGPRIASILAAQSADVVVVTEGVRELLPSTGSVVDAGNDWGYGQQPARRKVIVWSRFPLSCDAVGESGGARGRLAVTTAQTPSGPLRIIGVCIPWRDAHVSTGRADAQPWSEHMEHLDRLEELLAGFNDDLPTVIAGDFNQRIPRGRQPIRVAERLAEVLGDWEIHTAGSLPNGPHIDHIATNRRLVLESTTDWAASDHLGRLSDHAGVACRLGYADTVGVTASPSSLPEQVRVTEACVEPGRVDETDGRLTAEMRAEIVDVLRRSGEGLSHGATFQLWEQGLSDAEIADKRGVSVAATRVFRRSLDALLAGTLPTTESLALTNSYVYRELLNHPRSDELDSYIFAQLRKLQELNSKVRFDPLNTRHRQYAVGKRKQQRVIDDPCPTCAADGIIHAGRC
ncbi:MAG TPA: endonuclease/exonuclease/phosphatase family protein [Mycobacterium sp.]|nr:endonuclease/exonuclease/phosphatase family protein [Mycobacterium sp.]